MHKGGGGGLNTGGGGGGLRGSVCLIAGRCRGGVLPRLWGFASGAQRSRGGVGAQVIKQKYCTKLALSLLYIYINL